MTCISYLVCDGSVRLSLYLVSLTQLHVPVNENTSPCLVVVYNAGVVNMLVSAGVVTYTDQPVVHVL